MDKKNIKLIVAYHCFAHSLKNSLKIYRGIENTYFIQAALVSGQNKHTQSIGRHSSFVFWETWTQVSGWRLGIMNFVMDSLVLFIVWSLPFPSWYSQVYIMLYSCRVLIHYLFSIDTLEKI